MFRKKRKAQAILEYIIVLTALVAGFALAKQAIQDNIQASLEHASDAADELVAEITFVK